VEEQPETRELAQQAGSTADDSARVAQPGIAPGRGQTLGPYRMLEPLGAGAMGTVYRALDPGTGRHVALKVPKLSAGSARRERLLREGQAAARLSHPNIVRVHALGEDAGVAYLACELVEGARTFDQVAPELSQRERVELLRDAARAVGHAHAQGVLHRDLKPENLLVDAAGQLRVADFGLARLVGAEPLTQTGALVGTPAFMAPEQVLGALDRLSPATDVWALGATLHWALSGGVPFEGDGLAELAHGILHADPAPLPAETPAALAQVCGRALRKAPAQRIPDGEAFAAALDAWLDDDGGAAGGWAPVVVAGLGAAVLLVVTWALTMGGSHEPSVPAERASPPAPRVAPEAARPPAALAPEAAPGVKWPLPPPVYPAVDLSRPLPGEGPWARALRERAAAGDTLALVDLSFAVGTGDDVDRDADLRARLLHQAARAGHVPAQAFMGHRLLRGATGAFLRPTKDDPVRAAAWLRLAAAGGDLLAPRTLRDLLEEGRVLPQLPREAERLRAEPPRFEVRFPPVDWDEPLPGEDTFASVRRSEAARGNLGTMLSLARALEGQEPLRALAIHHHAALRWQVYSQTHLGRALRQGGVVPADLPQAAFWLRRAADLGSKGAIRTLCQLLEAGQIEAEHPDELARLRARRQD
jgi:serine/threonine-protein kinase